MAFLCPPAFPKDKFSDYEAYDGYGVPSRPIPLKLTPLSSPPAVFGSSRLHSSLAQLNLEATLPTDIGMAATSADEEQWSRADDEQTAVVKPYTEARITTNFQPTVDDEIEVMQGERVRCLYKEEDWLYVIRADKREGFIPASCCQIKLTSTTTSPTKTISPSFEKATKETAKNSVKKARKQLSAGLKKRSISGSLRRAFPHSLLKYRSKSTEQLKTVDEASEATSSYLRTTSTAILPTPLSGEQSVEAQQNVSRFLDSLARKVSKIDEKGGTENDEEEKEQAIVPSATISADVISSTSSERSDPELSEVLPPSTPFLRHCSGRFVAAFDFAGNPSEEDLSVRRGQLLVALNCDDVDWYWVSDESGAEGFVPANHVLPIDVGSDEDSLMTSSWNSGSNEADSRRQLSGSGGVELYVTRDFCPQAHDDLHVVRGDWIYTRQRVHEAPGGWLWAYNCRTRRHGFVPAAFVKPPVSTVL